MAQALPPFWTQWLERSHLVNGNAVEQPLRLPPTLPHRVVHFGVMIPDLPAPYNFFNIIVVNGQPRTRMFSNTHLIRTSAADTASVLLGTAVGTADQFRGYSLANDCEFDSRTGHMRFDDELEMEGVYPNFTVRRSGHAYNFELRLKATDKIAHFTKMRASLYDHWAILCQYDGYLERDGVRTDIKGLCTYEYANASLHINLPFRFFTYQILNVDEKTQVLMVQVLGPMGLPAQRRIYVRSVDDHGGIYSRGFDFTVHEYEAQKVVTPEGVSMRLPRRFSWRVDDEQGRELISIEGDANGDFKYGMTSGYAGSYGYHGRFRGKPITGAGYIEYIDLR